MTDFSRVGLYEEAIVTSDPGQLAGRAFEEWLATRPELWCAGCEVQLEVYASLIEVRPRRDGND